ncbi:MAG: hypothetical protein JHC31_14140 [Sulfurihydrogenibium sp.]|nr:hypothetical protein [Sulfurihydrogenibium sp.]
MQMLKYESIFRSSDKGKIEYNGYKWQSLDDNSGDTVIAIKPKKLQDIAIYYPLVVKLVDDAVGLQDDIAISLPASLYADVDARADILTRIWKETGKNAVAYPSGVLNVLSIPLEDDDGKLLVLDIGYNFVNFSLINLSNQKPLYMKTLLFGLRYLLAKTGEITVNGAMELLKKKKGEKILSAYLEMITYRIHKEIEAIKEKEDRMALVGGIKHFNRNVDDDEFSNVKSIAIQSEMDSIDFGTAFIKVALQRGRET